MIGVSEMCKTPTVVFNSSCDPGCKTHYLEVGLTFTFSLIYLINGYGVESRSYPWVPVSVMSYETIFLEDQKSLLRNVSSWFPRVDLVSVQYPCVFHPFHCNVTYTIRNASAVTVLNATGKLAEGTDLEFLREGYYTLYNRWTKICEKVRALDLPDEISAAFVILSGTGEMFCIMVTETPVRYTLTLDGEGLDAISTTATLRSGRTASALIVNRTSPSYDFRLVNCSISSPFGWRVEIRRQVYEDVGDGLRALGVGPGNGSAGVDVKETDEKVEPKTTETRTHVAVPVLIVTCFVLLAASLCLWVRRSDFFARRSRAIPTIES